MRLSRHALGLVFGLALGIGGCSKPSTVLLVEVEGPAYVHPNQLRVTVTAGIDAHVIMVPAVPLDDSNKMQFPTSFTISLDQSYAAPIGIRIDALDKNVDGVQAPISYSGITTYQHVEIGGQTVVTVVLTEDPTPGQPGGGIDGAAGAAGTGGDGAGSGGGGSGGAAGQDGAAGGAGQSGLGLSLDGAAD